MTDIEQVRAALEEIGNLIEMIECSNKDNLALLPLFLEQQKRALAALAALDRMEQSGAKMTRAQALGEAAQLAESFAYSEPVAAAIRVLAIRALKEQP
jgi:hypothetical protein